MKVIAPGEGWYSLTWAVQGISTHLSGGGGGGGGGDTGSLVFGRGGFQSGQGVDADGPNFAFFVENLLEVLDSDGEYFYDPRDGSIYICNGGGGPPGPSVELAVNHYLLSVEGGSSGGSVQNVSIRGLSFLRSGSTILERHTVPGGGDLAAHPQGALTIRGAEGVTVANCSFLDIGGSAVVVFGHAERISVVDSSFIGAGAHQVLLLGKSALADATGPDLPRGAYIAGNAMRGGGRENKFAAPIAVALAPRAHVAGNVVYECPRTAIYYNDVTGSPGQRMHNNALFNTNRETTDTGPVYVYNRLAFLGDNEGGPSVEPDISNHTGNLLLCNYGCSWPLDYDDGTRAVHDSANVHLYAGMKAYYGCCTSHFNNFIVYPDIGDSRPGFGNFCNMNAAAQQYFSGYDHAFYNNTCVLSSSSAFVYDYDPCNATNTANPPMTSSYQNTILTPAGSSGGLAALQLSCGGTAISLAQWNADNGNEAGSITGPLPEPSALAAQLLAFLPGPISPQ